MWPTYDPRKYTPAPPPPTTYVPPQVVNVYLHLSPALESLLTSGNREVLAAITQLGFMMTQKMDDFKVQFATFITKLDVWIAAANANQANSDALVAAAVQAERDGEDVDVEALSVALAAESDKVPAPPTPPAPEPAPEPAPVV